MLWHVIWMSCLSTADTLGGTAWHKSAGSPVWPGHYYILVWTWKWRTVKSSHIWVFPPTANINFLLIYLSFLRSLAKNKNSGAPNFLSILLYFLLYSVQRKGRLWWIISGLGLLAFSSLLWAAVECMMDPSWEYFWGVKRLYDLSYLSPLLLAVVGQCWRDQALCDNCQNVLLNVFSQQLAWNVFLIRDIAVSVSMDGYK